jgi:curved DNA-binding protein
MLTQDYYTILGVDKKASAADIKKAYRKLAVKYHPDKTQGDKKAEEKFKQINEANDVLGDPEKRKKYDALGENWRYYDEAIPNQGNGSYYNQQRGGGQQFHPEDFADGGGGFSDFFQEYFGGGSKRKGNRAYTGGDVQATFQIPLEEAFTGVTKTISIGGQAVNLKLKPGIADGQTLRLKGRGNPGINGGAAGDLLLTITIAPHFRYERRGDDLYIDQTVSSLIAIVGGKTTVVTLHKTINLTIPPGTENGKIFRLKGMGMPHYDHPEQYGDAYIKVVLQTPKDLSKDNIEKIQSIVNSIT